MSIKQKKLIRLTGIQVVRKILMYFDGFKLGRVEYSLNEYFTNNIHSIILKTNICLTNEIFVKRILFTNILLRLLNIL